MKIAVIGTGYVGLVTGACFAESGNEVTCVDIDADKIDRLSRGEIPIYEPGLDDLVGRNLEAGRLDFTTDLAAAVRKSHVLFIAVGTPPGEDGSADLTQVLEVARGIGAAMNERKIVVTKSTVPVGSAPAVRRAITSMTQLEVHVCSNPEFLKEGSAVDDFMKPDRIVIGADSAYAAGVLRDLYAPFVRTGHPVLTMDVASAEITKYAANSMLAARISFMNSIARLCEATGADAEAVRLGVGSDTRIGDSFLFAGVGYGGSCFPKDVKALVRTMRALGVDPSILEAVDEVNEQQKRILLECLEERMGSVLAGRRIAVWGLAFKPNTDDMREAPSLVTIEGLLERGASVVAHDPVAMDEARRHFGDRIEYERDNYRALMGAHALLIHTEWHPYRRADLARMRDSMATPLVFDGRNLYDPDLMAREGFEYRGIGRGGHLRSEVPAYEETRRGPGAEPAPRATTGSSVGV